MSVLSLGRSAGRRRARSSGASSEGGYEGLLEVRYVMFAHFPSRSLIKLYRLRECVRQLVREGAAKHVTYAFRGVPDEAAAGRNHEQERV